ncbi:MAG TPA: hypothetical protein VL400_26345 [Polyangiaceae bacterium]|nr:hypothetical protein [Polyangiaceae bacterium]
MRLRSPLLARGALACALAFSMTACDEPSATSDGDSTSGEGGGSSVATSGEGGATTSTGDTAASTSTSTGPVGEPCISLADGVAPNPTPGHCEGSSAVTCGKDGFLETEACAPGYECREYALDEWRFDGAAVDPTWVPGRTVDWAGCVQAGAAPCETAFNGNYYEAVDSPHCEGADKVSCRSLPAPSLFDNSPQLQYGADMGWVETLSCAADERCAGSDTLDVLTCIPADTPACDGTEPSCTPDGIEQCWGTWESLPGYRLTEPCPQGQVCYEGDYPFCDVPGEVPCDESTFTTRCEPDGGSIVYCYAGYTHHGSCATCWDGNAQVPCRCDDSFSHDSWSWAGGELTCSTASAPECIPQTAVDCDPSVDADTCVGTVARRCLGHWDELDCASAGMVCGVASGIAGCMSATATACDVFDSGTCNGTAIDTCCGCGHPVNVGAVPATPPCVPGFSVTLDCADLGGNYSCMNTAPPPFHFAECTWSP